MSEGISDGMDVGRSVAVGTDVGGVVGLWVSVGDDVDGLIDGVKVGMVVGPKVVGVSVGFTVDGKNDGLADSRDVGKEVDGFADGVGVSDPVGIPEGNSVSLDNEGAAVVTGLPGSVRFASVGIKVGVSVSCRGGSSSDGMIEGAEELVGDIVTFVALDEGERDSIGLSVPCCNSTGKFGLNICNCRVSRGSKGCDRLDRRETEDMIPDRFGVSFPAAATGVVAIITTKNMIAACQMPHLFRLGIFVRFHKYVTTAAVFHRHLADVCEV